MSRPKKTKINIDKNSLQELMQEIYNDCSNVMNNAKTNLRLGNQSKNMQNTKLFCTNTSGCKGVSYYKRDKMWECSIIINKNKIHLGKYRSFIYACVVRKRAAKLYFGDWRRE